MAPPGPCVFRVHNAPDLPAWLLKWLPGRRSARAARLLNKGQHTFGGRGLGAREQAGRVPLSGAREALSGPAAVSRGTEWTDRLPELASLTALDDVVLAKAKHKLEQRLQVARWRPSTPARAGAFVVAVEPIGSDGIDGPSPRDPSCVPAR